MIRTHNEWNRNHPERHIRDNEVHVWLLDGVPPITKHGDPLSSDEKDRAARFKKEKDRQRFIAAHSMMRTVLGFYVQESPNSLVFSYNPNGKPFLPAYPFVQFNLSHSGQKTVLAVSFCHAVGIDIECTISTRTIIPEMERLALSKNETSRLNTFAGRERQMEFLKLWTRKEAYLKAIGAGLSLPPNQIEFVKDLNNSLIVHPVSQSIDSNKYWSSCELPAIPECIGNVVTESSACYLNCYYFSK